MTDITNNEMRFVLNILKNPENDFNANNMAEHLEISSMGALKIAKRLENENILNSKTFGRAKFYKVNLDNEYTLQYVTFLLKYELEHSSAYVKRWCHELKKVKSADAIILYGSVLKDEEKAKDIDSLLITKKGSFTALKKEVEAINLLNVKKIHPVYQSEEDFRQNIKKHDKVVLDALKGVIVLGEHGILEILR